MWSIIVPFLVYWLSFFVTCYALTELFQDQFYDEVTPQVGLKVTTASFLLAVLSTWLHPSFESLFTSSLAWMVLQALVWVGVFILILQFHPWHGLAIGLVAALLIPGLTTLGVDNIMAPTRSIARVNARGTLPVRKSLAPAEPPKAAEPAKPAAK